MTAIRRYPVAVFVSVVFILSVLISYAPVGSDDQFLLLAALIVPIPTLVALALAAMTGGVRAFWREDLNWRVTLRWILIALGIALAARLLTSILALLAGMIPAIEVSAPVLPLIVVTYVFALLEEIGWRGFALRRLVMQRSPFAALLITGIPWSVIHIFYYFNQGMDTTGLAQVFIANFALTVMVTWIYLRSDQKLWISVILHGSQTVFAILNGNIPADVFGQYWILAYSLIALALLVLDWRMWIARPDQKAASQPLSGVLSSAS